MLKKIKKNRVGIKDFFYKSFKVMIIALISVFFIASFLSYNEFDPSPFSVGEDETTNILGITGAYFSAIIFFLYGQSAWLLPMGLIFLIRLVVVNKSSNSLLIIRVISIFITTFMISLSFNLLGLNEGLLGKTLIFKINKYLTSHNFDLPEYIFIFNLIIFALFYLISISKSFKSFLKFYKACFMRLFKIIIVTIKYLLNKKETKKRVLKNKVTNKIRVDNESFNLPTIDFLDHNRVTTPKKAENIDFNSKELEKVLDDYGIKGEIVNVTVGPIVTRYELEPAPGTRSSRIISLADDIARSMSAKSARVSVIYGKNAIGIELPNRIVEKVYLREIISSTDFYSKSIISFALGKDISGKPIITDLSKMPHILIAGTTGSGKSVSINAMILSILYKFSPEECKLILIDPKMLELSVYEDIPHLLHPVVTDPRKAIFALKWAVREMNERYKQMATLGVRNIDSYNSIVSKKDNKKEKILKKMQVGFDNSTGKPIYQEKEIELTLLPFLVVVVDEMADLMLTAGKEIEVSIQALAQKARAAGIHLVLATQRPSVDVITGTIKANLPYRISFQVTSKIDSRTILGEQGAEQLLGKGDMLFMAGGGYTERIHGPFVSDQEILNVTNYIKSQAKPNYLHHITEDISNNNESNYLEEQDPLYEKALSLIMKERKVSTSFLQRHFAIGYNRAARIVDSFEKRGIVSSPNSMGRREILVDD